MTATWLSSDVSEEEINIPGFKTFRKDRDIPGLSRDGGLLIFVRENISATILYEQENSFQNASLLT